jgi:hypothetical protein
MKISFFKKKNKKVGVDVKLEEKEQEALKDAAGTVLDQIATKSTSMIDQLKARKRR